MRRSPHPALILILLLVCCASLATLLQPRADAWSGHSSNEGLLKVLLGDGRRLFSNHFFVKADVSFHSGYYPSIFDRNQASRDTRHLTSQEGSAEAEEHEKQMNFLGPPRDWIERFGRHFMITTHTHLEGGAEREILPWLKISAELDPQRVETYTVAAYWLRDLGRTKEAEQFLREGLRNNPNSYEILFELGRLYYENQHDPQRARNVWQLALKKWNEQEAGKKEPDFFKLEQIALNLERLEEAQGNWREALNLLRLAQKASPHPQALEPQIREAQAKLDAPSRAH
jgi:tetratricopeptide (TPR) repeat protein